MLTYIIEYYEGASQEWYQYGDKTYSTRTLAARAIYWLKVNDHCSTSLTLRVSPITE